MLLTTGQVHLLAKERVHARARLWAARVDEGLPPAQRGDPPARLAALTRAVIDALGPQASFEAADVNHASRALLAALHAGAPWSDTRAAAQLHAAAGLGALWYIDDRLLPPERQIELATGRPEDVLPLLAEPQGARFKQAAARAHLLGPGVRMALHRALAQDCSDAALHALMQAAFAPTETTDDAGEDDEGATIEQIDDTPLWPSDAPAFVGRARSLQAQAGLRDPALCRLCLAGDLALGLGRCTRRLAADPPRPPSEAITLLTEALHAATQHQH